MARDDHDPKTFACRYPAGGYPYPVREPKVGISLSGGGSLGAFTAGIIHTAFTRFLSQGRLPKISVAAGTSTGSLVAALLVNLYGRFRLDEDPRRSLDDLEHVYTKITQNEVGKVPKSPIAKAYNLLVKKGLMDIEPLRVLVDRYYSSRHFEAARQGPDGVVYSADVIDMVTGLPVRYRSDQGHPRSTMIDAIFASCAQPVVMTPAYVNHHWAVDGGVREVIPFREALHRGCTHVLAVALNEPRIDSDREMTRDNEDDIFARIARGISVMNDEVARDDERMARLVAYINHARDTLEQRGVSAADIHAAFGDGPLPPSEKPLKTSEHDPYDDGAYHVAQLRELVLFRFEQQCLPSQEAFVPEEMKKLFDKGRALAEVHMEWIEGMLFAAGELRKDRVIDAPRTTTPPALAASDSDPSVAVP